MIRHIPNLLTCCNLVCGFWALWAIFNGYPPLGCWLILSGAVFDVFDGLVARALGVHSDIGRELDSLADVITFGAAPAALLWSLYHLFDDKPGGEFMAQLAPWAGYAVSVLPAASALRLARFNLTPSKPLFEGLPTPANALFILSLYGLTQDDNFGAAAQTMLFSPVIFVGLCLTLAVLLNVKWPLFGLKGLKFSWATHRYVFLFVAVSAALAAVLRFAATPVILPLYFVFSALHARLQPK